MSDPARSSARWVACAFVIFGAMGDLTKRKLLPSLYNLRAQRPAAQERSPSWAWPGGRSTTTRYREYATEVLREFATRPVDGRGLGRLPSSASTT